MRTAILAMLVANALKPADAEPRQIVDFLARDFVGLVPAPGTPHRLSRSRRQTNAHRRSVFDRIRAQAPSPGRR